MRTQSAQTDPANLENLLARMDADRLHHIDEAAQLMRWVMATCVAVNGGAMIGLLSGGDAGMRALLDAGLLFTVGIIAAIGGGLFAAAEADGWARTVNEASVAVAKGTDIPRDGLPEIANNAAIARVLQIGSLICFVIGCALSYQSLDDHLSEVKTIGKTPAQTKVRWNADSPRVGTAT